MPLILPALRLVFLLNNAYETFKALKPSRPGVRGPATGKAIAARKREMKGRLAIWIVWVSWTILERIVDNSVAILIPFYSEIKCFVLLFLLVSRAYGAEPIFLHIIRPLLSPYTGLIDTILDLTAHLGDFLFVLLCFPFHWLVEWWYHGKEQKPHEEPPPPYPSQSPAEARPVPKRDVRPPSPPTPTPTPPQQNGKPLTAAPNGGLTEAQQAVMQKVLKQADAVYEGVEGAQQRVREQKRQQPVEPPVVRGGTTRTSARQAAQAARPEPTRGRETTQTVPPSRPQPAQAPSSFREQRIEPARPLSRPPSRGQIRQVMPERQAIPERPVQQVTTRRSSSSAHTRSSSASVNSYSSIPPSSYHSSNPAPPAPRTTSSASHRSSSSRSSYDYDPNGRVIPGVNDGRASEFGVMAPHIDAREGIDRPSSTSHRSYDSASYTSSSSSRTRPSSHARSASSQTHQQQQQQSFPVELEQPQLLAGSSDDLLKGHQEEEIADVEMTTIGDDSESRTSTTASGSQPNRTKSRVDTLVPKTQPLVPKKRPAKGAAAKSPSKRGRASGGDGDEEGGRSETEVEETNEVGSPKKKRRVDRSEDEANHELSSPSRRSARTSLASNTSHSSSTTAASARQPKPKASAPSLRPSRITRPPSRADDPVSTSPKGQTKSSSAQLSQKPQAPGSRTIAASSKAATTELRAGPGAGRGAPGAARGGRRLRGT